jgi:hypothetical protein
MSARALAASGALLIAVVVPASAEALVQIAPLKPCYVGANTPAGQQTEGIAITATGFTQNSTVTITLDGQPVAGGQGFQTDQAGTLNLQPPNTVPAPFPVDGTRGFELNLTEVGNPANTATATAKTTPLGVTVTPRRARPSQRIRFKGSGFTGDAPIYAHYVYKNKHRKTVRMARRPGACGSWSVRKAQIPVKQPGPGKWIVQFDQSKRYRDAAKPDSGLASVFVRLFISVTLVRPGG